MTNQQFDAAYRAFSRRRPFRSFRIELVSGSEIAVGHPEAIRSDGLFYVARSSNGDYALFAADAVCRLLD
jgi:hypothetical protein